MNIFESTFEKHKKYLFESLGLNEIRMSREDAIKIFTNFGVTGVENLSPDDLKKKYRELATKHHPDMGGKTSDMQDITNAYDVLKNPNYTNTSFTPRRDEPKPKEDGVYSADVYSDDVYSDDVFDVDFGADVLDGSGSPSEHRSLAREIEQLIKESLGDRYAGSMINPPSYDYFGVNFSFRGTEEWFWKEGSKKIYEDISYYLESHYGVESKELDRILDWGLHLNK